MEKKEFVYTVGEIFGKVLEELPKEDVSHGATVGKYYIGPYQRGYKWSSQSKYDQVPQLLKDVQKAWQASLDGNGGKRGAEGGEYYLQYVTVLKKKGEAVYEVIDGQQRLTTLAIVFDRLHHRCNEIESIGEGRMEYSRYDVDMVSSADGIEANDELCMAGEGLFDKIKRFDSKIEADKKKGEKTVAMDDTQDLYYITSAVLCIDEFFAGMTDEDVKSYADFLKKSVKIILNRESDFVTPEEVFVNLNGNSVGLTNAYLIKGLLLTRSVNTVSPHGEAYSYFMVMEQRKVNGRVWDEIQNWVEQPDVARFFFGEDENGMEHLLTLLMKKNGGFTDEKQTVTDMMDGLRLFNKYNEVVVKDEDAIRWLNDLRHSYHKLRSWHEDADVYNLLGFVLFPKKEKKTFEERINILVHCLGTNNEDTMKYLAGEALNVLPDLELLENKKIGYHTNSARLTPLLLSLSVFPEGFEKRFERYHQANKSKAEDGVLMLQKFNFPEYDRQHWTYEHIRPQNPKDDDLTLHADVKEMVLKMYENHARENGLQPDDNVISEINEGCIKDVRQSLSFLYPELDDEDSMGNMALLSREVNSAINNNPYLIKRFMIFHKASEGAFIPPHTMAVFTKAINVTSADKQLSVDLMNWNNDDVEAHIEFMKERNKRIRNTLEKIKDNKKKK
ncbi:MAG: DUF262 domain-containing protein [Prevotellaceae bacterium]|nr:DUF262 domain-containing protein [Prevotellaceae bacterium]